MGVVEAEAMGVPVIVTSIPGPVDAMKENETGIVVKKGSIKIGLFTSNKKGKKDEIKLLDEKINYISRCQNDIIAIKNEYNKLLKNKDLKGLNLEEKEVKNEEKEEDPLERTINFYMAKQG